MKYLILILSTSILLSGELEVDGDLKVTGTIQASTIDSLLSLITQLEQRIAQLECHNTGIIPDGYCDCFFHTLDLCGVCDGDTTSCQDCAGVPNGDNVVDTCGYCDNDSSNDCVQDCNGEWGGTVEYDACGTCAGDAQNQDECDYSLRFDGNDDYVIIEGFESTVSLTMSIWFKPENNLSNPIGATCLASFSNWTGNPNSSGYSDFIGNHAPHGSDISGLFAYSGSDGQSYIVETTTSTWINTEWHNITYTRDSDNNQVIYVDGVDQDTDIIIGEPYWINTLFIGGLSWLPEATWYDVLFNGEIDDVSVWDIALSPSDINYYIIENNITGNEPGLNGYWNFNEGTGSTANDLSPNGRAGEIWGNPEWIVR